MNTQTIPAGDGIPAEFVRAYSTSPTPPPDLDTWSRRNPHLFRTEMAVRHFTRKHRAVLTKSGALVRVGGKWFINTDKWPAAFEECVQRDTERCVEILQAHHGASDLANSSDSRSARAVP